MLAVCKSCDHYDGIFVVVILTTRVKNAQDKRMQKKRRKKRKDEAKERLRECRCRGRCSSASVHKAAEGVAGCAARGSWLLVPSLPSLPPPSSLLLLPPPPRYAMQ
jgi:hypothetical protein